MSRSPSAPSSDSVCRVFVGMGSNVGDRLGNLQAGIDLLAESDEMRIAAVSPVYRSAAHVLRPGEQQEDYYNAVVELLTSLSARRLLHRLLDIERRCGRIRKRGMRWMPRTLDLDILVYGSQSIDLPGLQVPHPRLAERRFVIQPLMDLEPDLFVPDPVSAPVRLLLPACPDQAVLRRLDDRILVPTTPTQP